MTDYKAIFEAIESSMYANSRDPEQFRRDLAWTHERTVEHKFSDEAYYHMLLVVTFASGFNAKTAEKYRKGIAKHFPDVATSAQLNEEDIARIIASGDVIRHKRKLQACVNNAQAIQQIAKKHGSLQQYIDSYRPTEKFENLMLLNEALRAKFDYISNITVYHLMTDVGLPVLKPDLAITRLFTRLGLIESPQMELHAILLGRKFAEVTGYTMRYIDAVFVNYGQKSLWDGSPGICVNKPRCDQKQCGARSFCAYYKKGSSNDRLPL